MNTAKSTLRIIILFSLFTLATIGILSEPEESNWLFNFVVSKSIGFGAAFISFMLVKRWKNDATIKMLQHFCENE